MSNSLIVWLSIGAYVAGALITWKIMYAMVYGDVYTVMAKCQDCVNRAGFIDPGESHGCSVHGSQYRTALLKVGWATALWPIFGSSVGTVALVYYTVVGLGRVLSKIGFPHGNRNKGYLVWQEALMKAQYTKTEADLRRELRSLGINDRAWLPGPDNGSNRPHEGVNRTDLEYFSRAELSQRLAEVTEQLSQAKAISSLDISRDDKRKTIQSILDARLNIGTGRYTAS